MTMTSHQWTSRFSCYFLSSVCDTSMEEFRQGDVVDAGDAGDACDAGDGGGGDGDGGERSTGNSVQYVIFPINNLKIKYFLVSI